MAVSNFNSVNESFRKLLGNGLRYRIPRFQRDYSWSLEEWEDLWADLLGTLAVNGEPVHYMGYLVLQTKDSKSFDVIDGQQRITTLSLIVLAVIKNLIRLAGAGNEPEDNARRAESIRQSYIGYLDSISLISTSKLSLNRNDDGYFQDYIVPLRELPQRGNFKTSELNLRKAFLWFDSKVKTYLGQFKNEHGKELATFVENMSDKLLFTSITVTDELNAYKVFETLNSRGVRLSATDLLKNYLFSVLHQHGSKEAEMNRLDNRWEEVVGRLGSEDFPDFLRIHWNSRNPLVRTTELFKEMRKAVRTRKAVFDLISNLQADVETYLEVTQPTSEGGQSPLNDNLATLRLFNVTQPYPLLLAAKRLFRDSSVDFGKVVRGCVVISLRYNVIGSLSPSEQESAFNRAAVGIEKGDLKTPAQVLGSLSSIYPNDAQFKAAFAEKSIATTNTKKKKIVRYVLCRLESIAPNGVPPDVESESVSIEHVFPQNPLDGWSEFPLNIAEASLFRLGNMTLLKTSINRDVNNLAYEKKRLAYESSQFAITKQLAEDYSEWTPEALASRQQAMAKLATGIWRIDQLS